MSIKNQVLIVESSRTALSDTIRDLTSAGVNADLRVALNGGHALLHITQLHFNNKIDQVNLLVILNIHTPICNGFDFLKEYSEDQTISKNKIKIAALSDNLTPLEIEQAESLGLKHFISSPLTINQFEGFAAGFFDSLKNDRSIKKNKNQEITQDKKSNYNGRSSSPS